MSKQEWTSRDLGSVKNDSGRSVHTVGIASKWRQPDNDSEWTVSRGVAHQSRWLKRAGTGMDLAIADNWAAE